MLSPVDATVSSYIHVFSLLADLSTPWALLSLSVCTGKLLEQWETEAKSDQRFGKNLTHSLCHTEVWRCFSFSNSILSSFDDDVRVSLAEMAGYGHRTRVFLQHDSNGTYLGIFRTSHGLYLRPVYEEGRICSSSSSKTPLPLLPVS